MQHANVTYNLGLDLSEFAKDRGLGAGPPSVLKPHPSLAVLLEMGLDRGSVVL